jgi:hypothetical protein
MWTLSDARLTGKRTGLAALLLVLCISLAFGAAAFAAPQSSDRPPATAQEKSDLRRTIESRYEVLPVSGGVVLKPRKAVAGIRTIEVTGNQIAVNGEVVSPRTVRDWLGADAEPVIRLQAIPAAERREIFGLEAETAAPAPTAPEASPSGDETATSDETDVTETTGERPEQPERPEAPEPPETPSPGRHSSGDRVNVGGSVHVRADEVADEVVAVGGAADVEGEANHGVTAIAGPVRIKGRVGGDVVAVGGSVFLGPHAVVEGDVTSVGGHIEREPGAVINGSTNQVDPLPFVRHQRFHYGPSWNLWGGLSNLMGSVMGLILMGLLVSVTLLVARRPFERVDRQLVTQPWQAVAVGLAGSIFFWPLLVVVTILLAITIIGCVLFLLYPFLLLYVGLLLLLGYSTVAYRVGRLLEVRFSRSFGSPWATALVGVVAIQGWHVLGNLLDLVPGPFGLFASLCWLFGLLATISAVVVGFGAVILARFGLAPGYWPRRGAPPAPSDTAAAAPGEVDYLPLTDPMAHPSARERWDDPGEESEGPDPSEPR